ncbi:MAG TPA: hypothetical protein DCM64_07050 [Gammaproteobacteria bacterium]|jgi:hypothetical protein|nr:hypothetical protein [Gammaproteobacteria bacterium]MDP6731153.1 hypothetical protein [Gammaproteobacteria bacterium]HAJ76197.1 hypothetical protein [Gammaproteobacteria bacterium]
MKQRSSIILYLLITLYSATAYPQEQLTYPSLLGSWEGPLVLGRDNMNLAFTFALNEGEYTAALISGGLGIYGMPADTVRVEGLNVIIRIPRLDLEFTGTLRLDGTGEQIVRIDGDWFQYSEMVPVVLLPVDAPTF